MEIYTRGQVLLSYVYDIENINVVDEGYGAKIIMLNLLKYPLNYY